MKADWRRCIDLVKSSPAIRVVLLFGNDAGLISQRAVEILRLVVGTHDDPFRISELDRPSVTDLVNEMASVPLTGGRRVVRVRAVTDALTPVAERALRDAGDCLVLLEGGELMARGKLRRCLEGAREAVSVGCYTPSERDLAALILASFGQQGCRAEPGVVAFLASKLGADFAMTSREIEKLLLFVGPDQVITVEDVRAITGDAASMSADDAIAGALNGQLSASQRALDHALGEGSQPIGIIRRALFQAQRRLAASSEAPALGVDDAPAGSRGEMGDTTVATQATGEGRTEEGWCRLLWRLERSCKKTGAPTDLLCRDAFLQIGRRAAWQRGR